MHLEVGKKPRRNVTMVISASELLCGGIIVLLLRVSGNIFYFPSTRYPAICWFFFLFVWLNIYLMLVSYSLTDVADVIVIWRKITHRFIGIRILHKEIIFNLFSITIGLFQTEAECRKYHTGKMFSY